MPLRGGSLRAQVLVGCPSVAVTFGGGVPFFPPPPSHLPPPPQLNRITSAFMLRRTASILDNYLPPKCTGAVANS